MVNDATSDTAQRNKRWILATILASAGIGASVFGVILPTGGSSPAIWESIIFTFGIYTLSDLPPRQSAVAATPAALAFLVLGYAWGLSLPTLSHAALLFAAANAIGMVNCVRRNRDRDRLEQSARELTGLINTDPLTGVYNRFMFDDHLARVWRQSRREKHNLSVLIVDIDHMQMFNDRYGHPEGDRCIRRIGDALKKSVRRPLDFVARYDGSRFALALYDPPTAYIRKLVVGIQTTIAELHIPNERSPTGPRVTVSIGAVVLGPDTTKSLEGALQFAEEAVSASKLRGRDRAVVFQSSDLERATNSKLAAVSARP